MAVCEIVRRQVWIWSATSLWVIFRRLENKRRKYSQEKRAVREIGREQGGMSTTKESQNIECWKDDLESEC